ncbi:hypothetical protein [Streptomyces hydrogenans]|uniref:hypothetical protein n=1 Tax=Streptomyces hydrogenans TaxID=1873719 RepID=UPI00381C742C
MPGASESEHRTAVPHQLHPKVTTRAWAKPRQREQARIVTAANKTAGRIILTSLRILLPSAAPVSTPANVAQADLALAAPTGPVKTREAASEGYRRALVAHQEAVAPRRVAPAIAEAVEGQTAAIQALSRRAFPEPEQAAGEQLASIEQTRTERRHQAHVFHTVTLRRAHAEPVAGRPGRQPRSRSRRA